MNIIECAYNGQGCNLFPNEIYGDLFFQECEAIPISKCPYKQFITKQINAFEMHEKFKQIQKQKEDERERNV